MTEAELAEHYNRIRATSDFDRGVVESISVQPNVTIAVRFSSDEIEELRARAERDGVPVTAYIRVTVLNASDS